MAVKKPIVKQLFGTNGIRGIVNDTLGSIFACEIGMALGTFCNRRDTVIGTDGRTSNEMLKLAVTSGLLSTGTNMIDIGIAPTPVVQFAVPYFKADLGITITASHNPPEFNGIKCAGPDGAELMREDEVRIERIYSLKKYKRVEWNHIGSIRNGIVIPDYVDTVCKFIDIYKTKKAHLKVIFDSGNGTTSLVTPYILKKLGCTVITINNSIDGTFPSHPSEPTEPNAAQLKKAVIESKADFGIIQDGDGDRAIFIDEKGNFLAGERSLAILANGITKRNKGGVVVTPVNGSSCIEDTVKANGGKVLYTRIGSPSVIKGMKDFKAVFGGEEAGGLVFPEFQYAKDGMMASAKMVELIAKRNCTLSKLNLEIPFYYVYKAKINCPDEKKKKVMEIFKNKLKKNGLKSDSTDGVKLWTKDGWVLVRPSGTEPIYRVFVERKDKKGSEIAMKEYMAELEKIVKNV